jgi:hypothetical protein
VQCGRYKITARLPFFTPFELTLWIGKFPKDFMNQVMISACYKSPKGFSWFRPLENLQIFTFFFQNFIRWNSCPPQNTTQKYYERFCSFRTTKRTYRQRLQNVKPTQPWTFRGLCNLFRTTILPLCTPEQNSGEILRSPGNFRVRFPWVVSASLENYKIPPSVKAIFSSTIILYPQKEYVESFDVCAPENW